MPGLQSLIGKGKIILQAGESKMVDPCLSNGRGQKVVPDRAFAEHGLEYVIVREGPHKGKVILTNPWEEPVKAQWGSEFLPYATPREREDSIDVTEEVPEDLLHLLTGNTAVVVPAEEPAPEMTPDPEPTPPAPTPELATKRVTPIGERRSVVPRARVRRPRS